MKLVEKALRESREQLKEQKQSLEEANIATVTGEAFGDPNCIRISYAASEAQIKEAVKRIKEALS